ncbi:hypothetical protein BGW39_002096 [Mortierella sp. 14UC]|nr:hypothetical protein BGW39_002096 [Mortierella sp. 14UC]
MTKIRSSSRQMSSSAASTSTPDPDTPEQTASEASDPSSDSTHQSNEPTHEKSDQQLEATDPDIPTNSSESSTVDQVKDAVGTPINSEIEEEEPVSTDSGTGGTLAAQEEALNSERKIHSVQLADHIKGVPEQSKHHYHNESEHGHDHDHDHDQNATTSAPKDVEANTTETNRHGHSQHSSGDKEAMLEVEELDSTKHAKRTADDQARERHDYLAGAYKSPFRHTHKVEKVGREER